MATSIDNGIVTIGLDKLVKKMERLRSSDPDMADMLNVQIRRVLMGVRARLAASAASGLKLKSDPRQVARAVRYAVYKKVFGGNVNILNKRHAGSPVPYQKATVIREGQWGGNRRSRSARTEALDGYFGSDRGFIFRFLNNGTDDRQIKFHSDPHRPNIRRGLYGGDVNKYGKTVNTGNRGGLRGANWFGGASQREMLQASAELDKLINNVIAKMIS